MALKVKLDDRYYLEDNKVIFEDKQASTANVIFNAQQVHAIELLFERYNRQKSKKISKTVQKKYARNAL